MANQLMLALFHEVNAASGAIEGLRRLGVPDNRVTVMSSIPLSAKALGRRPPRHWLPIIAMLGGLAGFTTAILLLVGTPLLYPVYQGGQPLIPIPPSLIITFELTMLGLMWVTFGGFWLLNRFPRFGRPLYDPRIGQGMIGVAVEADPSRAGRALDLLKNAGAVDVRQEAGREQESRADWVRWLIVVGVAAAVVALAAPLFVYDLIRIPFGTQMDDQASVPYQGGPRLAAPAESVPFQGAAVIAGQPGSLPVPTSANSTQRGQVLYGQHCFLCHGPQGAGDGPLSGYFRAAGRVPADLSGTVVQALPDQQIFLVITNGFGLMPPIHEDLVPEERWDVVNYVRTLKK